MRIYKIKSFTRFCKREGIADRQLVEALESASRGLGTAALGGEVFKLRIARKGEGKSGGYRTIVAIRQAHRTLFLYGYAKADEGNISDTGLAEAKMLAREGLSATQDKIDLAVSLGLWTEVFRDGDKLP